MRYKPKYRLLFSYIITYLLIFIIPFSFISMIFYYNSVKSLRAETEISNINNLNNIKNIIDTRMRDLMNMGALISIDPELTPYWVNQPEQRATAVQELYKYKQTSSIIDELYLYYFDQDNLFSSNGHMPVNTFLQFQSDLKQTSKDSFRNNLKEINYPSISTNVKPFDQNPTFAYPLPPGTTKSTGIVFMKLESTFFQNMINNILGGYEGTVLIFDQNNHPASSYSTDDVEFSPSQMEKILTNDAHVQEMEINKTNYSIVKVKSDLTNWSYVMALPTKQFFSKVSEFKVFMLLVLFVVVIVMSFFTIYIALKNFHPIQKMVETVKKKDTSVQLNSKNDLMNLSAIIEKLYIDHDDLNDKYSKQEPLIRDRCLTMFLNGESHAILHSKDLFNSLDLDFNGPQSFVIVTAPYNNQLSSIDVKELEIAANQLLKNSYIYGVELINDKVMAFIVNGEIKNNTEKNMFIFQLNELLKYETFSCIGVGKTYQGEKYIHRSFIEASAAFEYGMAHQKNEIIYFEEIKENHLETVWLPKTDLLKLTQSCKQGNIEIADEALKSLIAWLLMSNAPIQLMKHMKYDMVNTIIKIASEMGISLNLKNIYDHMDKNNLQQFQKTVSNLIYDICAKISEKKEDQGNRLQVDIFDFIQKHFQEYDFSLEKIARDFNLSTSYLSRLIKEETTQTFSQYVWELRLNEVKKQLIETTLPIKDIISSVGYINAPNFTRKFKTAVGLTPSEYRNIHSKNK